MPRGVPGSGPYAGRWAKYNKKKKAAKKKPVAKKTVVKKKTAIAKITRKKVTTRIGAQAPVLLPTYESNE